MYWFPKRVLSHGRFLRPSVREEKKMFESNVSQAIPKNYMERNV